jgi:hypothetical protein
LIFISSVQAAVAQHVQAVEQVAEAVTQLAHTQ